MVGQKVEFSLRIGRNDIALGILVAGGVTAGPASAQLRQALRLCIAERQGPLLSELERRRAATREVLKNGRYRPTGRAKPASEYLHRAAAKGTFMNINHLVDAANLVSLEHLVPISLWDLDRAGSRRFEFRLGAEGESYAFNQAEQRIQLSDLLTGYAIVGDGGTESRPIVTPVKDSLATKTTAETQRVAACIYYPLSAGTTEQLSAIASELQTWLLLGSGAARGESSICRAGQTVTLTVGDR